MKPELEVIQQVMASARLRLRWQRGLNLLGGALFIGALAWVSLLVAHKLFPIPAEIVHWTGAAVLVAAFAAWLAGFLGALPDAVVARQVDAAARLKDRLATAIEIRDTSTEWARLQLADAAGHARGLQGRRLFPVRLDRSFSRAVPVLLVAAVLTFVPEYRTAAHQQAQTEHAVMQDVGQNLAQVLKRETERPVEKSPETVEGIEGAIDLAREIERVKLTRAEALKELASVQEKLQEQTRDLAKDPTVKAMQQAARQPQGNSPAPSTEAEKRAAEMAKALDDQNKTMDEALAKLQENLQQAKDAGAAMANSPEGLTADAKQQMAQQLAEMSKMAEALGASLPDLESAIEALRNSQPDAFLRDMNAAMRDLESLKEMAAAMAAAQKTNPNETAKTLADQLKQGQFNAARATLDKMAEQLKKGEVSEKELSEMLKDVAKACENPGNTGKVGECLSKAASAMKDGDQGEGGQQLAAASEEIKRLLEQMNDLEALQASLDAVNRAQMALALCQKWGQCKSGSCEGSGVSLSGINKAGRGSGWNQNSWDPQNRYLFYPTEQMAMNIPGSTPDRAPENLGDGQMTAAMNATKIRGQINPEGSMPSVTLKGVSIKGTSRVQVQEAITAAQSEARAAISDDKVPRAYRGAVRDYFDDMKE